MKWSLILAATLLAADLPARQGLVETRDGRSYEGLIQLLPEGVRVINAAKGFSTRVASSNLLELTFKSEPLLQFEPPKQPYALISTDGTLPAPWQSEDIGSTRTPGSVSCVSSVIQLYNSGTNFVDSSDAFHYVYKQVKGDSEIVVRALNIEFTDARAKAGLMMRENLKSDSRHVAIGVTAGKGGVFASREEPGGQTQSRVLRGLAAPCWLKLKRDGNTFTGYRSLNGRVWAAVERVSLELPEEIYVGVAAAGFQERVLNRSTLDNLKEARALPISSFVPKLQFRSGSAVSGAITSADASEIEVSTGEGKTSYSTKSLAHLLFQWVPSRLSRVVNAGRPGVILTTGEFVEGEFQGIENGKVRISSILFGLRSYNTANELIAVVLQQPMSVQNKVEIRTTDGTAWQGTGLEMADNEVVLQEASLGTRIIPIYEVAEIRCRR